MNKDINEDMVKYKSFMKLSLSFGFLFMFAFYDMFLNFNGIFYPVFVAGLFILSVLGLRKLDIGLDRSRYLSSGLSYIIMAILLGISSNLTSNEFIIFFNTILIIILYGVFITKCLFPKKELDLFKMIGFFINMIFLNLGNIHLPFKHIKIEAKDKNINTSKIKQIIEGVIFALLFLIVVIPLLMSSDLIFANLFNNIGFNFKKIFNNCFVYLFLLISGTCIFYSLFSVLAKKKDYNLENNLVKTQPIRMITMTWFITAIYLLYSSIQIIYLIGGNFFTLPDNLTYAEYARSGFFQLLAVAFINLSLVLLCVKKVKEDRWLDISLRVISGCTFIMIASATYRMILYINVYYLTFIRVLVLWFLLVLTICMIGIVYYIHNKSFYIYRFLFVTSIISYLIFGFIKPDYIIAKYNISHMETIKIEDMNYILDLSLDAVPALENITEEQYIFQDNESTSTSDSKSKKALESKLKDIINNHNNRIRYFNISRWRAYKTSKYMLK
ncbi:MAG TPA: DUF4173 domain-containing protein [Clostridiales bacterium]|nr:DUF4173 domain-containing protein [Clostridiales bacterium]